MSTGQTVRCLVGVKAPSCSCFGGPRGGATGGALDEDELELQLVQGSGTPQIEPLNCALWIGDTGLDVGVKGEVFLSYKFWSKTPTDRLPVKIGKLETIRERGSLTVRANVKRRTRLAPRDFKHLQDVHNELLPQLRRLLEDIHQHPGLYHGVGTNSLTAFLEYNNVAIQPEVEGFRLHKMLPDGQGRATALLKVNTHRICLELNCAPQASQGAYYAPKRVVVNDLASAVQAFWKPMDSMGRMPAIANDTNNGARADISLEASVLNAASYSNRNEDGTLLAEGLIGAQGAEEVIGTMHTRGNSFKQDKGIMAVLWYEHGAMKALVQMVSSLSWSENSKAFELARRAAEALLGNERGLPVAETFIEAVSGVIKERGSECLAVYKLLLAVLDVPAVKQAALKRGFMDILLTQYRLMTQELSGTSSSSSSHGTIESESNLEFTRPGEIHTNMMLTQTGGYEGTHVLLHTGDRSSPDVLWTTTPTSSAPHVLFTGSEGTISTLSLELVDSPYSGIMTPGPPGSSVHLSRSSMQYDTVARPDVPRLTFYWLTKPDMGKLGTGSTNRTTISLPDGRAIVLDDAEEAGQVRSGLPPRGSRSAHVCRLSAGILPTQVRKIPFERVIERTVMAWGVPSEVESQTTVTYQIKCAILEAFLGFSSLNLGNLQEQLLVTDGDHESLDGLGVDKMGEGDGLVAPENPSSLVVTELLAPTWQVYPGEQPPVRRGPGHRGGTLALAVVHEFACRLPQEVQSLGPPGVRLFMPQDRTAGSYHALVGGVKNTLTQLMAVKGPDGCVLEEAVSLMNLLGDFVASSPAPAQAQLIAYSCKDIFVQMESTLFKNKGAYYWSTTKLRLFHALLRLFKAMLERAGDVVLWEFLIGSLLERAQWVRLVKDYTKVVLFSGKRLAEEFNAEELGCLRVALWGYFTALVRVVVQRREGYEETQPGPVPRDFQSSRPTAFGQDSLDHLMFLVTPGGGVAPRVLRRTNWEKSPACNAENGGLHAQVLLFLKALFSVPRNGFVAQSDVSMYYLDFHWLAFKRLYMEGAQQAGVDVVCRLHLEVVREIISHRHPHIYYQVKHLGILELLSDEISLEAREHTAKKLEAFLPPGSSLANKDPAKDFPRQLAFGGTGGYVDVRYNEGGDRRFIQPHHIVRGSDGVRGALTPLQEATEDDSSKMQSSVSTGIQSGKGKSTRHTGGGRPGGKAKSNANANVNAAKIRDNKPAEVARKPSSASGPASGAGGTRGRVRKVAGATEGRKVVRIRGEVHGGGAMPNNNLSHAQKGGEESSGRGRQRPSRIPSFKRGGSDSSSIRCKSVAGESPESTIASVTTDGHSMDMMKPLSRISEDLPSTMSMGGGDIEGDMAAILNATGQNFSLYGESKIPRLPRRQGQPRADEPSGASQAARRGRGGGVFARSGRGGAHMGGGGVQPERSRPVAGSGAGPRSSGTVSLSRKGGGSLQPRRAQSVMSHRTATMEVGGRPRPNSEARMAPRVTRTGAAKGKAVATRPVSKTMSGPTVTALRNGGSKMAGKSGGVSAVRTQKSKAGARGGDGAAARKRSDSNSNMHRGITTTTTTTTATTKTTKLVKKKKGVEKVGGGDEHGNGNGKKSVVVGASSRRLEWEYRDWSDFSGSSQERPVSFLEPACVQMGGDPSDSEVPTVLSSLELLDVSKLFLASTGEILDGVTNTQQEIHSIPQAQFPRDNFQEPSYADIDNVWEQRAKGKADDNKFMSNLEGGEAGREDSWDGPSLVPRLNLKRVLQSKNPKKETGVSPTYSCSTHTSSTDFSPWSRTSCPGFSFDDPNDIARGLGTPPGERGQVGKQPRNPLHIRLPTAQSGDPGPGTSYASARHRDDFPSESGDTNGPPTFGIVCRARNSRDMAGEGSRTRVEDTFHFSRASVTRHILDSDDTGRSNTESMTSFQTPSDFEYTGDMVDDARRLAALERKHYGYSSDEETLSMMSTMEPSRPVSVPPILLAGMVQPQQGGDRTRNRSHSFTSARNSKESKRDVQDMEVNLNLLESRRSIYESRKSFGSRKSILDSRPSILESRKSLYDTRGSLMDSKSFIETIRPSHNKSGSSFHIPDDFEFTGDVSDDVRHLEQLERKRRGEFVSSSSGFSQSFCESFTEDVQFQRSPVPRLALNLGRSVSGPASNMGYDQGVGFPRLALNKGPDRSRSVSIATSDYSKTHPLSPSKRRKESNRSALSGFKTPSDFEYTGDVSDDARRLEKLERRFYGYSSSTFGTLSTMCSMPGTPTQGRGSPYDGSQSRSPIVPALALGKEGSMLRPGHHRKSSSLSGHHQIVRPFGRGEGKHVNMALRGMGMNEPQEMPSDRTGHLWSQATSSSQRSVHYAALQWNLKDSMNDTVGESEVMRLLHGRSRSDERKKVSAVPKVQFEGPLSLGHTDDGDSSGKGKKMPKQGSYGSGADEMSWSNPYTEARKLRAVYHDQKLHSLLIEVLLEGMLLEEATRSTRDDDNEDDLQKILTDIPLILLHHLNHACCKGVVPLLTERTLNRSPQLFRLLRLLVRSLFPADLYKSTRRVAKGAFAHVHQCTLSVEGAPDTCAVKVVDLPGEGNDQRTIMDLYSEVSILEQFDGHQSICHLYDYGITNDAAFMVMKEYKCSLLEWRQRLPPGCPHALRLFLRIFRSVVEAVKVLHEKNVVHFDLKCSNVLLEPLPGVGESHFWSPPTEEPPFRVVLADFGEARSYSSVWEARTVRNRGTEFNKSPEMLMIANAQKKDLWEFDRRKRNGAGPPSDVWALGCLMFEIVTGQMLQYDDDWARFFVRVTRDAMPVVSDDRVSMLHSVSNAMVVELLQFMLERDQAWRPSLTMVARRLDSIMNTGSLPPYVRPPSNAEDIETFAPPVPKERTPGIDMYGEIAFGRKDVIRLTQRHLLASINAVRDPWALSQHNISMVVLVRGGGPPTSVTGAVRAAAARANIELLEMDLDCGSESGEEPVKNEHISALLNAGRAARVGLACEPRCERELATVALRILEAEGGLDHFESVLDLWRRLKG